MALFITIILGLFILVGALITFIFKNSNKFVEFSLALATGVIGMLIFLHLLPDAIDSIPYDGILKYGVLFILVMFGFILLLVLDRFIPDHDDDLESSSDDDKNLKHIGLVSSIALAIHNIVEGMAVYILATSDLNSAIMTGIGIGLHNIPLGIVIASTFYKENNSIKKTLSYILLLSLSTFIGGFIIFITNGSINMELLEMITINLTIGMLFFILFMELLPKVFNCRYKIINALGIILGFIILIISYFFE